MSEETALRCRHKTYKSTGAGGDEPPAWPSVESRPTPLKVGQKKSLCGFIQGDQGPVKGQRQLEKKQI